MNLTESEKAQVAARWPDLVQSTGECLLWTGSRFAKGYGRLEVKRKTYRAHRLAYYLAYGPFDDALLVCHTCDTPKCVNPAHLFLGTHADNHADRNRKGRQARGERNGHALLSAASVRAIRQRWAAGGVMQKELAREYGVSPKAINKIVLGRLWREEFAEIGR